MKYIYGCNIDSCLNKLLIEYYTLQQYIDQFEYYRDNIIGEDQILNDLDFIEAKNHIKKSRILIHNLYIKNKELCDRIIKME